jgi:hypothetical protein
MSTTNRINWASGVIRLRNASCIDRSRGRAIRVQGKADPMEKQRQVAAIKLEHPDFDEQDVADFLTFLSFKEQRADLYKRLADA